MDDGCLSTLQKRKAELDEAIAENRQQRKKAKQQLKDQKKAGAKVWKLSETLLRSVLIVYMLCGYRSEPCVVFLIQNGRRRHWPEKSAEDLLQLVEDAFMAAEVDELHALADTEQPLDVDAMGAAQGYVQQWRLAEWARSLNAIGIAPSTENCLQRLEQWRLQVPAAVRPRAVGSAAEPKARMWASGWRNRFQGRHGRLRVRDDVPVPELRTKVV
jgi:hypothetical protein